MLLNEKIFLKQLKKITIFENNPHIAVGVSGGPDSIALAFLLSKWIKIRKGKITALVFDHRIRNNSKEESFQVKNMLANLNIDTLLVKPKKNKLIKKNMANARKNRFEGLINICKKKNILHLFLGHHFDDNLETYLIRKINGSNLEGLDSMNILGHFNNIQIVRPLLETDKLSILNFNKKKKLIFLNDPTNKDLNYTRVKIRKFLENKKYKEEVRSDFLKLKKQIPNYKKMIWEILIKNIIFASKKTIKVSFNKLVKLDDLIIEKQVLCILKFLTENKTQTKSSKIMIFINLLKKPTFKKFNLNGINIHKKSDFLEFSQK